MWDSEDPVDYSALETPDLMPEQREQLHSLVQEFEPVFAKRPGKALVVEHHIRMEGEAPIRQKAYRVPYSRHVNDIHN